MVRSKLSHDGRVILPLVHDDVEVAE